MALSKDSYNFYLKLFDTNNKGNDTIFEIHQNQTTCIFLIKYVYHTMDRLRLGVVRYHAEQASL